MLKSGIYFFLIASVFTSCCKKKDCDDINSIDAIHLINFTEEGADTVIILSFPKNSNYASVIDSFFFFSIVDPYSGTISILTRDNITVDRDYIIRFSNSVEYKLDGFIFN